MASESSVLPIFLLLGGSILAGFLGHALNRRYRISDIVVLLATGILAGPVLGILDTRILAPALPFLAPLCLSIVLFEGGLELAWEEVRKSGGRAVLFSLVSWVLTGALVALAAMFLFDLRPFLAIMWGAAVASTGIIAVIPLLAQLKAPSGARVLLTLETSLGDLLSVIVVTTLAGMAVLGATATEGATILAMEFSVGAAVGVLAGVAWARVLYHVGDERYGYALTLAVLVVAYAATETLAGSGYLMALTFGLVLGNAGALTKQGGIEYLRPLAAPARIQQSEIIFILRSVFFVFLGASVGDEVLTPGALLAGAALAAVLIAARVLTAWLTFPGRTVEDRTTRVLLVAMMPRGLANAIIAGIPFLMGVPGTERFVSYTFILIVASDVATSFGVRYYDRLRRRVQIAPEAVPQA